MKNIKKAITKILKQKKYKPHTTATTTDLGNSFNGNGFVFGMIWQIRK
jgi:hypothetical protein